MVRSGPTARSPRRLVQDLVRRGRHYFHVFRHEPPALDQLDELGLDLVRQDHPNPRVLLDVRPLSNEKKPLRVLGIAAQHAVFHLGGRLVHRIAVRIVEFLEQPDEFFFPSRRYAEIVDVQEIPDLEEAVQDDITTKVAQAPNIRAARVQALTELDSEIVNSLPVLPDGIDLSLLTNALTPVEKVHETDQAWDYDSLFTNVSSEIQTELDIASGEAGEKDYDDDDLKSGPAATANGTNANSNAQANAADRAKDQKG